MDKIDDSDLRGGKKTDRGSPGAGSPAYVEIGRTFQGMQSGLDGIKEFADECKGKDLSPMGVPGELHIKTPNGIFVQ